MAENNGITAIIKAPIGMDERGIQLQNIDQLWRFSELLAIAQRKENDKHFVAEICIKVQQGLEIGMSPLQAVNSIAVINGKPALYGDAFPAQALRSGMLEYLQEWYELDGEKIDDADVTGLIKQGKNVVAVCRIKRKDRAEHSEDRFSMDDARAAGLLDKAGPWKTFTKRMLRMRPRAYCFRDHLQDALRGVKMVEEVMDYEVERPVSHVPTNDNPADDIIDASASIVEQAEAAMKVAEHAPPVINEPQERQESPEPNPQVETDSEVEFDCKALIKSFYKNSKLKAARQQLIQDAVWKADRGDWRVRREILRELDKLIKSNGEPSEDSLLLGLVSDAIEMVTAVEAGAKG